VTKSELETMLTPNRDDNLIQITYINPSSRHIICIFSLIPPIKVKTFFPKKNIYVGITKLVENIAEDETYIAYKTNVTDMSNVRTEVKSFRLEFENRDGEASFGCSFRKYENTPLLIICLTKNGTFWLKEIKKEIILDEVNNKYNFRIQPVNNIKKIISDRSIKNSFIICVYPEILDFTKEDVLTVDFIVGKKNLLTGITFNEEAEDLICETFDYVIKRCKVPKSHFNGKKSGYYFTKHSNHLNGKSTSYEAPPIKIILPE